MALLDTLTNLLLIIIGFGLLIFIHELGHFLAAKWAGIRTEAFAIGMGTPVVSWRKGVGFAWGSTHAKVVARAGKGVRDLSLEELDRLGMGSTEYSLRWLPIGGFVKMLGQDDTDPGYVSREPGSYNTCPIGKRMVVVSAGVVANVILGVVLFVVAFMAGVQAEKPIIGGVSPASPAGTAVAINAPELGVSEPGLRPGDLVTRIDGKPVKTFVDVRIAAAMAKPAEALLFDVRRSGLSEPLEFLIEPEKGPDGLLSIGVDPGRSTRLLPDDAAGTLTEYLSTLGLSEAGLAPQMRMVSAAGEPIETFEQFDAFVRESGGEPVPAEWVDDAGGAVRVDMPVAPVYQLLRYAAPVADVEQNVETGLLGLSPLVKVVSVEAADNADVLRPGDVILRAGGTDGPRMAQLRAELARRARGEIDLILLRDGAEKRVTARVDRKGRLGIGIAGAWDVPLIAEPMQRLRTPPNAEGESQTIPTPFAGLDLMGRSRLDAVNDTAVADWPSFREALRRNTRSAAGSGTGAAVTVTLTHPTPGREQETAIVELSADEVRALHELGWRSELPREVFEPLFTTLSAGGNPVQAAVMGFQETHKMIVMTYLTIDRLVRGSVGVEQIHGPVGIVHLGARLADRGFTYLLFFLGIISVNLAVINFLPIPIVDGGLFLFLVYEKLKGRPPSIAFQNAATIVGVAIIATALLVVTWNDLMRLVG